MWQGWPLGEGWEVTVLHNVVEVSHRPGVTEEELKEDLRRSIAYDPNHPWDKLINPS